MFSVPAQICYTFKSKTSTEWLLLDESFPFLIQDLISLLHGTNIRASLPGKCILSVRVQYGGTLDFARKANRCLC